MTLKFLVNSFDVAHLNEVIRLFDGLLFLSTVLEDFLVYTNIFIRDYINFFAMREKLVLCSIVITGLCCVQFQITMQGNGSITLTIDSTQIQCL